MLTDQEIAVLLATRESENMLSLVELSQFVEAPIYEVGSVLDRLVEKRILEAVVNWDGIRYGYQANDSAQEVYCQVHRCEWIA